MTRYVSTSNQAAAEREIVPFRFLAEVQVMSSTLYLHSGAGTFRVGSQDYLGVGQYGAVDPVQEESDIFPRGLRLSLNGVNSQYLAEVSSQALFNKSVTLKRAFLVEGVGTLVASVEIAYVGRIDKVDVVLDDNERGNCIELTCESRLRKEPKGAYCTDEDQQLVHSGDLFFNLLTKIEGYRSTWGPYPTAPGLGLRGGIESLLDRFRDRFGGNG